MPLLLTLAELSPSFSSAIYTRRRISSAGCNFPILRANFRNFHPYNKVSDHETSFVRVSYQIRKEGFNPMFSIPVFSALLRPPSLMEKIEQIDGNEDKNDYYVNLGNAIRTLREDYPIMFYKEPGFNIYRDDIVFKDPLNTFIGIDNYKQIFSVLRFIGSVLFKALWIDIVSVWQPVENTIMIRWTLHGIRRVPWESHGRFDGISVYKLDRNGKIFEHQVNNIARNPPIQFKILVVDELIQALGSSSTPRPTYFETSLSGNISIMPFRLGFSFVGCYFFCIFVCFLM